MATKTETEAGWRWLSLEHELAVLVVIQVGLLVWGAYAPHATLHWVGGWLLVVSWLMGIVESEPAPGTT